MRPLLLVAAKAPATARREYTSDIELVRCELNGLVDGVTGWHLRRLHAPPPGHCNTNHKLLFHKELRTKKVTAVPSQCL